MILGRIQPRRRDNRRIAMATDLHIGAFVRPVRNIVRRKVGQSGENVLQGPAVHALGLEVLGHFHLQPLHLRHERLCGRFILAGLGGADELGGVVAAGLGRLQRRLGRSQGLVDAHNLFRQGIETAPGEAEVEHLRGFTDGLDVVHGRVALRDCATSLRRVAARANNRVAAGWRSAS